MKIKLKELNPNPYRDLKRYPIDDGKVELLRQSFKKTGFWDNIVVRKAKDGYEIAYGHHRLIALKKEFKPDFEMELPVKEIDDSDMIRIMADENDEYYGTSPAIINETVRVARDYLVKHPELRPRAKSSHKDKISSQDIALFLGWKEHRIRESLESIEDFEKGTIVQEVYEGFATQYQADTFRKEAKKINLTPEKQKKVAEKIKEGGLGYRQFKQEMLKEKFNTQPKKEKDKIDVSDFVNTLAEDLESIELRLTDYIIANFKYASLNSKTRLSNIMIRITNRMNELKNKNGGKKYEQLISK